MIDLNGIQIVKEDIEGVDLKGQSILLRNLQIEVDSQRGVRRVKLEDLVAAEQSALAEREEIKPQQITELLFLYAKPSFDKGGYVYQKYRFNKGIFYLKERLLGANLASSLVFGPIAAGRAGPIPTYLSADLVELYNKGLVNLLAIKDKKKVGEGPDLLSARKSDASIRCELTEKGERVAKSLWENSPEDVKHVVLEVKEELFLISAEDLKKKVHRDYPIYKKTYIELDAA